LCLCVQVFGAGEWTSVRSKNFNVAGEVTETELRTVAERLEQFREVFGQLFPQFGADSKARANVIIFRDADSYRPFKPKKPDGSPDDGIAGYFLAGETVNYITLAMRGGKTDPFHTIFHEYIHFLLKSRTGKNDLPPWLAEGLAQYYETLQITADNKVVLGGAPQGRLGMLRRGVLLPVSELFSAERTTVHGTASVQRSMFYAHSWLLVHYLLNQGPGRAQDRLERFLRLLAEDASTETALKQVFAIESSQLNDILREYLLQPELPVSIEPVPIKPAGNGEQSAVKISDALAKAYLGDLLHHMNRLSEAETYLREAIAADNKVSLAHSSLGLLLIRQEKFAEAARHLEIAIAGGSADYFVYFNYAYALSRATGTGGLISRFPRETAARMRSSLERAIELEPKFAESYRVLAFVNLVNDENLADAANLLEKGLSIRPGDESFEILLAKVVLRLERYDDARRFAEKLSQVAKDPQVRADAKEILSSITQYSQARLQISAMPTARGVPWSPSLLLLKRSWVSETDIAVIERAREITNLNRVLERPRPDEQRVLGTIQRVDCVSGNITYHVRFGRENLRFYGESFDDLRMAVLVTGQHSFKIDCGVRLPSNPAVLSFIPPADKRLDARPRLTSITFVPDHFELLMPDQLAGARLVIIENDLLKRIQGTEDRIEDGSIDADGRWASIRADLRPLRTGEVRAAGTLESINCSGDRFSAIGVIGGKKQIFTANEDFLPRWFSAEASQISMACGSSPRVPNVLFTYRRTEGTVDEELNLIALEFMPEGFPISSIIGR
jgi:tetratricopeptide (TPR) repeat protein